MLADELDIDLKTVAEYNVEKLANRKARGKLQGEGSNR